MKDSELEEIRKAACPLAGAVPGGELRNVVQEIKDKLRLIKKPAVGKQFTKLQNCLVELENGLWGKVNEVKRMKHQEEYLGILDVLWMVYNREGWSGGVQRELRKCCQMDRILRKFEELKCFQEGLEKAWEAYTAVVGLVGGEMYEDGYMLARPQVDAAQSLRTENTAMLVFSLVVRLIRFLGETGNGLELVSLKMSVEALDGWADLMESEKAKNYYWHLLHCIKTCVLQAASGSLLENDVIQLIEMHVAGGEKIHKLQGVYQVSSIVRALSKDWLGTVGGAVCRSVIETYGYASLCRDVVECFAWEIVNTVKRTKSSSIANDFLRGLPTWKLDLNHPCRSRFHLCAIGALCFDSQSVFKLDHMLCLEDLEMQINSEPLDVKLEGAWPYLVDGLGCLRVAGQFLVDSGQGNLENHSGSGKRLLQYMVKALKLPIKLFDKPHANKLIDVVEQKLSGLLRGTILSFSLASHTSSTPNGTICSLATFHHILELLTKSKYCETDVLSLAWKLVVLARSLCSKGYYTCTVQAYLGACYFYLKTMPKEDAQSIPVQNLQHCCWKIKEVLMQCSSHNLDAEIASFRDVVVRIVTNGWGNHSAHSSVIGNCVSIVSGLKYLPTGCIIEQSFHISNWRENLKAICNLAWMEIVALSKLGPGVYMGVMDSLLSIHQRLRVGNSKECTAFSGRIQIMCGIAAALLGKFSECESKITSGLASLLAVVDEYDDGNKANVLESLACGHLAFSLICAAKASGHTSDCTADNGKLGKPATFWWNQSSLSLAASLEKLHAMSLDCHQCRFFDEVFLVDLVSWASGLAGAQGHVDSESQLGGVLEKMGAAGILSSIPPKHGLEIALLGGCPWLGHCQSYKVKRSVPENSDCKSGPLSTIVSQIQTNMGDCDDHTAPKWLSAFFKIESSLVEYRDKAGFHAQIHILMLAARALFCQGSVQQSFLCVEKARRLSSGLHSQDFPEFGPSATRHTFMGDLWYVKKEAISAALLQGEIQDALGMPNEALWALEQATRMAASVEAHSFLAIASLQQASIFQQKSLIDKAWDNLREAQKSIKTFMHNVQHEKVLLKYLEAWCLKIEGDLVREASCPSSWKRAEELLQEAKHYLEGISPDSCMKWPIYALRLAIESSLGLCHQNQEPAHLAQEPCGVNLLQVLSINNALDYLSTDALSAIYQSSKLCRKALGSDRHHVGRSGVFFGLRSSCRKSLVDFFQDVDLTSYPSLQKGPDTMIYQESSNADQKSNILKWAMQTLSHTTLGSPLYIQVMLLCWNGFQELPAKLRDVSADLCAALAEGGKLHAAIYFLFVSMSPGFRLQSLACIKASNSGGNGVKDLLSHSEFEVQLGTFDLDTLETECKNRLKAMMSNISSGTCALCISYHSWTENVIIARLNPDRAPILVMLPAVYESKNYDEGDKQGFDLCAAVEKCKKIIKEQEDMFDGESNLSADKDILREWWSDRMQLDKSLCELIEEVNEKCLGKWSWLLGTEVNNQQFQELLTEASCQFVNNVTRSLSGTTEASVLTELVRLVYMGANNLSTDEVINAMQMLCNICGSPSGNTLHAEIASGMQHVWGVSWDEVLPYPEQEKCVLNPEAEPQTAQRRKTRISMMQAARTPLMPTPGTKPTNPAESCSKLSKTGMQRSDPSTDKLQCSAGSCGALLVLDPAIQAFPWENCPGMADHIYHRMPSLSVACALALKHQQSCVSNSEVLPLNADLESTFYVVNPYDDLPNLIEFGDQFSKISKWHGVAGVLPSWEEVSNALESRDVYIYLGHGSGEKFINSQELQKIKCRSACFIMGCSSGRLWDCGRYEPYGRILSFLMAGCPAVVSNLWIVADKDINRFSQAVIDSWQCANIAGDSMLMASSVKSSRSACKTRYLVGAAPVCYGVPVQLKKLRQIESREEHLDVIDLTMEGNEL